MIPAPRVYKCPSCLEIWITDEAHPTPPATCPIDGSKPRDISHRTEGKRLLLSRSAVLGAEVETALLQFMTALGSFITRESDLCPHCEERVEKLELVARSVYLRPCNCRLWMGRIPEAWKNGS